MTVLTVDGGTAIVESNAVELLDQPVVVYNLTVGDGHTYFVEDGQAAATPIWVHNACNQPAVVNSKLKNLVSDLYKGARGLNPFGTGSTADAVRNELLTGLPTHGRFHTQKAQEYISALANWLRKNPNASHYDRLVAQSILDDLNAALAGF